LVIREGIGSKQILEELKKSVEKEQKLLEQRVNIITSWVEMRKYIASRAISNQSDI